MPTYEYKCSACGHKFEKFQSIAAGPIKKCPECKKNKAQRLISAGGGLIFKGSGFYITDYRSDGYKEKAKADSAPATDSKPADKSADKPAASPVSTDAKPATKPDAAPAAKAEAAPAPKPESKQASKSAAKPKSRKS
jgi:putative FmdB family regulatory protein